MRTLRFIVNGQTIEEDPTCDFSGLFPGRNPEVSAEFTFSPEWDDSIKVVAFTSELGMEYEPQPLDEWDSCDIPVEALAKPTFKIRVLGMKTKPRMQLTTNIFTVKQSGDRR